ncbi:MAG: efflux RND transporter periplasmic adaptor subunit [Desulfovermiculus sp.]
MQFCKFPAKPFSLGLFSCVLGLMFLIQSTLATAQEECIPVDLTEVRTTDLEETIEGIGTLEARQRVTLKPEIAGVIEQVHFQEGSPVSKGELLFSIEDSTYKAQLRAKEAALAQAKAELAHRKRIYDRRKRLFAQNQISEEVKDEAETKLETARATVSRLLAEIDEIKEVLKDTKIRAPFDGITGELLVDAGNWVDAGTSLTSVVQIDELDISFTLPEKSIGRVQRGQKVRVRVPAYAGRNFEARVSFVSPQIASGSRSLLVKAKLDNPDRDLKPGGFSSVQLQVGVRSDVPVIPEEALIPTRTGYMVFVVEEDQAQGQSVEIGLRKPGQVEIAQGLSKGQTIIRTGHEDVQEGDRVCSAQDTD